MKKRDHRISIALLVLAAAWMTLAGCGMRSRAEVPAAPAATAAPAGTAEPAPSPETETAPDHRPGDRYEGSVTIEGMEETVRYEHIRNDLLGFEMAYDYERFLRQSETDRECFVSCWDSPGDPENYLEVRYSPLDAETAAAAVCEILSDDYQVRREDAFSLERAGQCIRILADEVKGGGFMPEHLQTVYVIPAADGCRVAAAHCATVESEGFLRRFHAMMNSFSAVAAPEALSVAGTWQTASMGYADDGSMQPEYYVRFTDSHILYGHLKDGQFVLDHTDRIVSVGEAPSGGIRVQAETANGAGYTYQTGEGDENLLEYFETWQEEEFPESYRGGASLNRCTP